MIITLTGSSRTTGQMTQTRTSYLPREIMWGHRFVNMTQYDDARNVYVADYDRFDEMEQIETTLCSARQTKLHQFNKDEDTESDECIAPTLEVGIYLQILLCIYFKMKLHFY